MCKCVQILEQNMIFVGMCDFLFSDSTNGFEVLAGFEAT